MNCYVISCGMNEGAIRSQAILADSHPNIRVKRHRTRRHLLLVSCEPDELPGVRDAIQSAFVMTALEPPVVAPLRSCENPRDFKQTTVSGRISSERLNMQQITPKSLHKHEWFAPPIVQVHDEVTVDVENATDTDRATLMELMRRFKL